MIEVVKSEVLKRLENKSPEFTRVFHGRGGFFKEFKFLSIDSIDRLLFVVFYQECSQNIEDELLLFFSELVEIKGFETVILQRRYLYKAPSEILFGKLKQQYIAYENGLGYYLSLLEHQNIGFFADMKEGRNFIAKEASGKNILNLFSYTCSFSVVAIKAGVRQIINVDMSKQALNVGRENHRFNEVDTSKAKFLPYNILKSWGKIKKYAPYDLIIIDPPSFQKGSFVVTKDYIKIVKRLNELCTNEAKVMACLNDPKISCEYLLDLFQENAQEFKYVETLKNTESFKSVDENSSLKCLIFKRVIT